MMRVCICSLPEPNSFIPKWRRCSCRKRRWSFHSFPSVLTIPVTAEQRAIVSERIERGERRPAGSLRGRQLFGQTCAAWLHTRGQTMGWRAERARARARCRRVIHFLLITPLALRAARIIYIRRAAGGTCVLNLNWSPHLSDLKLRERPRRLFEPRNHQLAQIGVWSKGSKTSNRPKWRAFEWENG